MRLRRETPPPFPHLQVTRFIGLYLPFYPMAEKIKGDIKMVTDYSFNEDGKKVKTVRHYKIERKMVPKIVAERRNWHKFGMSKDDKPGPNPQVQTRTLCSKTEF